MVGDKRRLEDPNCNVKGEEEEDNDDDQEEEEEEEEALSLCDLPIIVTKGENCQQNCEVRPLVDDHDFEFGSLAASTLKESAEMCAAEDVFFQGQILPLRLSVSSDNCISTGSARLESRNPSRSASRSDSMEHCSRSSSGGFTSSSSRSSSSRSHNSSSSSATTCSMPYKPKVRNLFHSHPSPKPQLWFSGSRPSKNTSTRNSRSTIWGLFRPGLLQTPEIELQQYSKLSRNNKSFNSSTSNSSIHGSINCSNMGRKSGSTKAKLERKNPQRYVFEGCKCSVDAIGTVSSRVVVLKGSKNKKVNGREMREGKEKKKNHNDDQKQRKEAMYHRRTFEWLKELSIADVLDEF